MTMTGTDGPWTSRGVVERGGHRLSYAEMGDGEVVVLLPKLGGWVADWRHVAPAIADSGRHVIAFDPPGHGGSTIAGAPPYIQTIPESAAAILAALDELGIGRFSLIGNSLGGGIAVAMAVMRPDLVSRLCLLSVSLIGPMSRAALAEQDAKIPAAMFGPNGIPLPRSAADVAKFGITDPAVIAEQNQSRAAAGLWLRPSERGVGRFGAADYMSRLEMPVLLIYGDRGHYLKYEAVGRRLIRTVSVAKIAGCGSFPHQESPGESARVLIEFLNG